jgi:hypothetical protein
MRHPVCSSLLIPQSSEKKPPIYLKDFSNVVSVLSEMVKVGE